MFLLVFAIEMTQFVLYFVAFLLAYTIPVLKRGGEEEEKQRPMPR